MFNILHTGEYWRNQKPPLGAQIDWGHRLVSGIVGCWLLNEGGGITAFSLGNSSRKASCTGTLKINRDGLRGGANGVCNLSSSLSLPPSYTVVTDWEWLSVHQGLLCGGVSSSDGGFALWINSDNTLYSCPENSITSFSRTNAFAAPNRKQFAVVKNGATNDATLSVYMGGKLLGTNSVSSAAQLRIDSLAGYQNGTFALHGTVRFVYAFVEPKGAATITEFHKNPNQFLYVPILRTFLFGGAAGGTTQVGASRDAAWNVRSAIGANRLSAWNTRTTTGANRDAVWNDRSAVSSARDAVWNVLSRVAGTRDATWNIRVPVAGDRDALWRVSATVGGTRVALWNMGGRVGSERAVVWNVRTRVGADRESLWLVRVKVGNDVVVLWNVRSRIGGERVARWGVIGPEVVIGQITRSQFRVPLNKSTFRTPVNRSTFSLN